MGTEGITLWLTGLSGAGKTTIAVKVAEQLRAAGRPCCILDGDRLRQDLCKDLGFSDTDRAENMRRTATVAALMADAGLTVIVALISPFQDGREAARASIGADRFLEIHIDAPLAVVERRDVKGLYQKARNGQLSQVTGIDSPYEAPLAPALRIQTEHETPEQSVARVMTLLLNNG
tara:strand:+ start:2716 stop:3243 length:528 start_codon:yes stop_codon:yes gene_type:complete